MKEQPLAFLTRLTGSTMKLINQLSLGRGRVLMDYAFNGDGLADMLEPADYIGLVAAYIARRLPTHEMREQLDGKLGSRMSAAIVRTFETFQDEHERGLWAQGPATDDISFSHPKLDAYYPIVGQRWRKIGGDFDVPF